MNKDTRKVVICSGINYQLTDEGVKALERYDKSVSTRKFDGNLFFSLGAFVLACLLVVILYIDLKQIPEYVILLLFMADGFGCAATLYGVFSWPYSKEGAEQEREEFIKKHAEIVSLRE